MKFELLEGSHADKAGKKYKKGDVVSSEKDLEKLFVLKFKRRVDLENAPVSSPVPVINVAPPAPATPPVQPAEEATGLGVNVTSEFSSAKEADYRVYRKRAWHYVVDPDEPRKPLNPKALLKEEIEGFIQSLLVAG